MRIGTTAVAAALALVLMAAVPARADVLYSVRTGDTLESIAKRHGLTRTQILQANPGLKDGQAGLEEGLVVVLPDSEGAASAEATEATDAKLLASLEADPPAPTTVRMEATAKPAEAAEAPSRAGDRHRRDQLASRRGRMTQSLLGTARRFLGTPYSMGATGSSAFDCSGFVMRVFLIHGVKLPRSADVQYNAGTKVRRGDEIPGDLVFFETYCPGPSHVGIYVGNGNFIHASSSRGVIVSSLGDTYYKSRYLGAKRVY